MELQQNPVDHETLNAFVGRATAAEEVLTGDLVGRFKATFDLPADDNPSRDAPLGIHFCIAPDICPTNELRADGHPAQSQFLPAPFPRRMWAGGKLKFHGPLRIGQTIRRESRISDVSLKQGRSGTLCFVAVEHRVLADGALAIEESQDIVYREMEGSNAVASKPEAAPVGEHSVQIEPSPVLLFRYSALTFNSHRIHYDRPYSVEIERYPGLVVHGPLQATLLLQFAEGVARKPPQSFSFRSHSPLFDGSSFRLNARTEDGSLKLWTAAEGRPLAMTAEARWRP